MRVDSIIRDVNLIKCSDAIAKLGGLDAFKNNKTSLMKLDTYFEYMGIKLMEKERSLEENNPGFPIFKYFCLSQVSFFKLADFLGLLRLRTGYMQGWAMYKDSVAFLCTADPIEMTYFCPYDVQPFRQHLFDSSHATLELFRILSDLGYSDADVKINNYDNVIEFEDQCIIELIYVLCDWINEYEIEVERFIEENTPMKGIRPCK
jgi:hypothetical protein